MNEVVVVIMNGFDPKNPDVVDVYSKASIKLGAKASAQWSVCSFFFTNVQARSLSGKRLLDAGREEARRRGVEANVIPAPTYEGVSDIVSAAAYLKDCHTSTSIVVYSSAVEGYFREICLGAQTHVSPGWRFIVVAAQDAPQASPASIKFYRRLEIVTRICRIWRPLFRLYASARAFAAKKRRRRGFTRTIVERGG